MKGAVALDFGATSARFATGRIEGERLVYEVIEQVHHNPIEIEGRLHWDWELLTDLADRALTYASTHFDMATLSVDTWGVDHGFVRPDGTLLRPPVCYREPSHEVAFAYLEPERPHLYALTGIQHQPFNTVVQLMARSRDLPEAKECALRFLPDLILDHLLDSPGTETELTMASTSQLLGLDGRWSAETFAVADWPVPLVQPSIPGLVRGTVGSVDLMSVGSHDTASAIVGVGPMEGDQAYLSIGTWGLLGCLLPEPLLVDHSFTNERAVDGQIRYLTNIPGFYVVNRVYEEGVTRLSLPEWLTRWESPPAIANLSDSAFFNPSSMRAALAKNAGWSPEVETEWAGLALASLVSTIRDRLFQLEGATGKAFESLRVVGGGSASAAFCSALASVCERPVIAGPVEATLLGNLAGQLCHGDWLMAAKLAQRSSDRRRFVP